jgi:DNA repair protein RecO (recombination protein O)
MLHKTKGIVLHHLKYGDNSLVVTVYTESHGRKTFLVQGVKHKGKFRPSFFQPFTLLNLEAYINPKRDLQRIKEIALDHAFHSLPFDIAKSAIAIFLSEILYKALREEEANVGLFEYLYHAIQLVDVHEGGIANFHLVFLVNLSKFLGFYPHDNYSETNSIFDTANGKFSPSLLTQDVPSDREQSYWMHRLLSVSFEELETLEMNHRTRNALLVLIIEFYSYHLGGLGNIKSLAVLQSVFEEDTH